MFNNEKTNATTETTKTTATKIREVLEYVERVDRSGFIVRVPHYVDDSYDEFMARLADYLGWED